MQAIRDSIYSFKARWFDPHAQMVRQFHVRYFVDSHNVEIFDTKTNKMFLKRSECPATVATKDFFIGAKVLLYGRHFELLDYLDPFTAEQLGKQQQKSVLVVMQRAVEKIGTILDLLARQQFSIAALKMLQVGASPAQQFLEFHSPQRPGDVSAMVSRLSSRAVVTVEVVAENCIEKLRQYLPTLASQCPTDAADLDASPTVLEAQRYREFFFETPHSATAKLQDCTCCVVLPHILKDRQAGAVIEAIQQADVTISAMELFNLDRTTAAEFLEVYEGVLPHFNETVDHLTTGPCIALELSGMTSEEIVPIFREHVGPWDVEMAKELKPQTIRARFGHDRVRNAVHCTDLTEDGTLESEFFFDILSKRQVKNVASQAARAQVHPLGVR